MKEIHLFIIWEKARNLSKEILEDIENNFKVLNIYEITWSQKNFSKNMSRFYGQNLPKNSHKEKHCGRGNFLLIIVEDEKPKYEYRETSRGKEKVNINMFDAKQKYREWTGGGHKIHGTNSVEETRHDIILLLDMSLKDYLKNYKGNQGIIFLKKDLFGSKCWKNLEEIFYILNETIQYVVLRNFENLPEKVDFSIHGDIDILCNNYENIKFLLNSEEVYKKKYRVMNLVNVANKMLQMDFRYLGDNYYCFEFEREILNTRKIFNGFYVPNEEMLFLSLLYHANIHKKEIVEDYEKKILELYNSLFENKKEIFLKNFFMDILNKKMHEKNYQYVEPKDYSVFYNAQKINKDLSFRRKILNLKVFFRKKIEKILNIYKKERNYIIFYILYFNKIKKILKKNKIKKIKIEKSNYFNHKNIGYVSGILNNEKIFIKFSKEKITIKNEMEKYLKLKKDLNFEEKFFPQYIKTIDMKEGILILSKYIKGIALNKYVILDFEKEKLKKELLKIYKILKNQNLIHRDINPNNIFIEKNEREFNVKLIDFEYMIFKNEKEFQSNNIKLETLNSNYSNNNNWNDLYSIKKILKEYNIDIFDINEKDELIYEKNKKY